MQKILLLSHDFDYSKMITYDAGPGYAASMGWKYDFIDKISHYLDIINIIDNRITEVECYNLQKYIISHKNTNFLLKVVDPIEESCWGHWYYKFLFRVKDFENVFFLSTYIPSEVVKTLDDATNNNKMVFIPYAFNDIYNFKNSNEQRIKKIVFSGAQNKYIYPERYFFTKSYKRNPLLWGKVNFLTHPGYPDINQELTHNIIGNKYIEYLSRFKFMFISPSRCGLELLKYSECAYAHCVPLGKAPRSFSNKLKEYFIELNFDKLAKSIKYIFSLPESELKDIVENYYFTLKQERRPDILNYHIDDFLNEVIK